MPQNKNKNIPQLEHILFQCYSLFKLVLKKSLRLPHSEHQGKKRIWCPVSYTNDAHNLIKQN
jgi:hypothetical protein